MTLRLGLGLVVRAAPRAGLRPAGPDTGHRYSSSGLLGIQERTLVAVKPDGVQRRLVGEIIHRFEQRGFQLIGMKLVQAPKEVLSEHYHDLQEKPFYPALINYMSSGPIVAMAHHFVAKGAPKCPRLPRPRIEQVCASGLGRSQRCKNVSGDGGRHQSCRGTSWHHPRGPLCPHQQKRHPRQRLF
ncbi:nucleoside diphosphate kinase, mitochondrial isoform X2 [Callorhinchus milii]|uniref:nucleoside diphosphate kinase, mitochondrial isoform X2 n=1 Tax=Callorhinchus milii TaxID=7868 RepID=UPI001C3F8718|nr:nucleoside diphosphate kinase, mitochondrial isoform X2 [Callorhinchus milii]